MIDLHTHTDESDGTCRPAELLERAAAAGISVLGISDHDTLAGYDQARELAGDVGIDLVCGIEISTRGPGGPRGRGSQIHLLGYFANRGAPEEFRQWVSGLQAARADRNRRLALRLQELGLEVRLEEAEALGRSLTGRPHFARVLMRKGYVSSLTEAFRRYLDESAPGYVERDEPPIADAIGRVGRSGGIPVLAHPVRLYRGDDDEEAGAIERLRDQGLRGLECYHSDHEPEDVERYLGVARRLGMVVTGGSDYHGANKPGVHLGSGRAGNVAVPGWVVQSLRGN